MGVTTVYDLPEPTVWATPPSRYSFSSLRSIQACPRKWQLLHSEWGSQKRFPQRPHPKTLEGTIVHEAIELLIRALGRRGLPSIGSFRFQEAIKAIDFWGFFVRETDKWNARLAEHPRAGPQFVLRTPPRELANRAIRLFRERYKPLDGEPAPLADAPKSNGSAPDLMASLRAKGALTEEEIDHPELPFGGIIDLVELNEDHVIVVDFKTGKEKEDHERQIHLYGLLWWRRTGVCPERAVVQYLNHRREFTVAVEHLNTLEANLSTEISQAASALAQHPAEAKPGPDCGMCPARARCAEGWTFIQASQPASGAGVVDVEVVVAAPPAPTGFVDQTQRTELSVVYEAAVGRTLPPLEQGTKLRVVGALVRDGKERAIEIRPWTEVYRVP